MIDRIKKRHLVLLSLLTVTAIASIFYLQSDRSKDASPIRPYVDTDFVPLVKLMNDNKFWITERGPDFNPEQVLTTRIPTNNPDKRATIDVIEADGQTAGFIAFYKIDRRHGFIWLVAVDKAFRGRKLGEQLVVHALTTLKQQGAEFVTLATRTINKPALGLYKKMGFVERSRDDDRGIVTLVKRNL